MVMCWGSGEGGRGEGGKGVTSCFCYHYIIRRSVQSEIV